MPSLLTSPGRLVSLRGREWVVLPSDDPETLLLKPLGGSDEEITGIYLPLEPVEPARFDLPDPARLGDFRSCGSLSRRRRTPAPPSAAS